MSYPFNIVINLILPIGTQKGTFIKFLTERSFPEMHLYKYCTQKQVIKLFKIA